MSELRDALVQRVEGWERLGAPALLERFILRNGKSYQPTARIGRKGKARACYRNASLIAMRGKATYVEGFTFVSEVHHAWVSYHGDDAMDPTLDAMKHREYIGVAFDLKTLMREQLKSGVFGLLDPGFGLNHELMFRIDPQLREIVESVQAMRRAS
jgi:hypothetical protein